MFPVTTAGEDGTEAALLLSRQDVPVRVLARHPEKRRAGLGVSCLSCPATDYEFDSPLRV